MNKKNILCILLIILNKSFNNNKCERMFSLFNIKRTEYNDLNNNTNIIISEEQNFQNPLEIEDNQSFIIYSSLSKEDLSKISNDKNCNIIIIKNSETMSFEILKKNIALIDNYINKEIGIIIDKNILEGKIKEEDFIKLYELFIKKTKNKNSLYFVPTPLIDILNMIYKWNKEKKITIIIKNR